LPECSGRIGPRERGIPSYAFSSGISVVILRNAVTKDLYVQLAEKRSSATTDIEILRPAWNGGLRMAVSAF